MSGRAILPGLESMADIQKEINSTLEGHKAEIRLHMRQGIERPERGLSHIDQIHRNWTLKPPATIEDLHHSFVQAKNERTRKENMSADTVLPVLESVAVIQQTINTALEGHKADIKLHMRQGTEQYERGLSQIDQTQENWTLKPPATIEDLHSTFVQAYKHMESASNQLGQCKTELDTCSRDMAELSGDLSEDLHETSEDLEEIKSSLATKKDVEEKADALEELEKDLDEKKEDLDEARSKQHSVGYAAIPLRILAPFLSPLLENDVKGLENKVESSQSEYDLVSDELDGIKEDERQLVSDKAFNVKKLKALRGANEKLRRLIEKVSALLQHIKGCCTVLGLIVNKFESLKEESDPGVCINLSALKIPINELGNSMQQNMITF